MIFDELFVSLLEVAAFGFVLPGEVAALPDVGVTGLAAAGFGDVFFVGVAGSR